MKNNRLVYEEAIIEIITLKDSDVITSSGGFNGEDDTITYEVKYQW